MVDDSETPDIRQQLEDILTLSSELSSSFAFSRTYADAPNPIMSLDGLGTIGLPLSEREAKTLISRCEQAPFGMGERTVIDKEVRDTWEMDASKVQFLNEDWEKWIQESVVKEVCAALGVNVAASKPRAELYKLLVYETGSHFLPHVDTEKTDGMFATLIVVLPSKFAGGDAHLSHAGNNLVFNTSNDSLKKTSVLAWYTDVMHEVKAITSGYRLALAYNFLHTSSHIRPGLSAKKDAVSGLRRVMSIWKKGRHEPEKIVYQLNHQYSRANLSASALKGVDCDTFTLLDSAAREMGFCIGLAHLELTLIGYPPDDGGYGYRNRRGWGYDEDDGDDGDDGRLSFVEVTDKRISIENLVDVDGRMIAKDIDFEAEMEAIPSGFIDDLENGDYDDQEYEGYMGNGAGSLERYYRRTALVLWPPSTRLGNGGGNRRAVRALSVLQRACADIPTEEEVELFDYACLEAPHLPIDLTLDVLGSAARNWKDLGRWTNAVLGFKGTKVLETLTIEEVRQAVEAWGWASVAPSVKVMIEEDKSNISRLEFLSKLRGLGESQETAELKVSILSFTESLRRHAMTNLSSPEESEMELLTSNALSIGGADSVNDGLLPQVLSTANVKFLMAYAEHIYQNYVKSTPLEPKNEKFTTAMTAVVTKILNTVLVKLDLFTLQIPAVSGYRNPSLPKSPQTAKTFLKLCLDCENTSVASKAIEKLVEVQGMTDDLLQTRTSEVLMPVLSFLSAELAKRDPKPVLPLETLGKVSIEQSLKAMESGKYIRDNVAKILDAAVESDDTGLVVSMIVPRLKSLSYDPASWKGLIEELNTRKTTSPFQGIKLSDVVEDLALIYVKNLSISQAPNPAAPYSSYPYTARNDLSQHKETVSFVMKMGGVPALTILMDKLLDPKLADTNFISSTLFPLITELRSLASTYKLSIASDPFAKSIRIIVNLWVGKVLRLRPDQTAAQPLLAKLKGWSCTCEPCVQAKKMLTESADKDARLHRIGKPKRVHVEGMLNMFARGAATYEMIAGSPQGLLVTKADVILEPSRWNSEQKKGLAMIKSIGNETVLKSIWGGLFGALLSSMNTGKTINLPADVHSIISTTAPIPRRTLGAPQALAPGSSTSTNGSLFTQPSKKLSRPPGAVGSAHPVTPAKRKATGPPEAIIDLCTP